MSTKSAQIPFQPAPRPQPRVTPEQTRELAEAARDLGFGRTTSAPAEAPAEPEPPKTAPQPAEPAVTKLAPRLTPAKPEKAARTPALATAAPEKLPTLKVSIPDDLWNALRLEALNRRVTVKYLVMEALEAKGYDIDLSQIAEDGRRLR